MPFQKVEYEFPHDEDNELTTEIEIEPSSEIEVTLPGKEATQEVEVQVEPEVEPEVEVVNDVPEADRNRTPSEPPENVTEEELVNYSKRVQDRLKHFSKSYHDERRAKETAERERDELEKLVQQTLSENSSLKETVTQNREALLKQAKANVEAEIVQAKALYKRAHEEGDSDSLVQAQEALNVNLLRQDSLNKLERESLQEPETPVENVQQPIDRPAPDPRAVAWKEQNTWFGNPTYEPETAFALGLHKQITEAEGTSADSNEYYEKLNSRMQAKFPELFEGTNEQEVQTPKQKTGNVVAPATRSTAPKKIRLTQTQLVLAKRLGLTPAQYAKQVAIDMRNNNG